MYEASANLNTVDGKQFFWEKVSVKGGAASFSFSRNGERDWCILARIVDDGRGDRKILEMQRSKLCDKIIFKNNASTVDILQEWTSRNQCSK